MRIKCMQLASLRDSYLLVRWAYCTKAFDAGHMLISVRLIDKSICPVHDLHRIVK